MNQLSGFVLLSRASAVIFVKHIAGDLTGEAVDSVVDLARTGAAEIWWYKPLASFFVHLPRGAPRPELSVEDHPPFEIDPSTTGAFFELSVEASKRSGPAKELTFDEMISQVKNIAIH